MGFDRQKKELEQLGFATFQSEDELVAVREKWYWDCLGTKLSTFVFIRYLSQLTGAEIQADAERMLSKAVNIDPSRLPRGVQKGRAIIAVYFADSVGSDAVDLCTSPTKPRFATFFFPTAKELSSGAVYYLRTNPLWGLLYYGKFRHIAQRLLEPEKGSPQEPVSVFGCVFGAVGVFLVIILLTMFIFILLPLSKQCHLI